MNTTKIGYSGIDSGLDSKDISVRPPGNISEYPVRKIAIYFFSILSFFLIAVFSFEATARTTVSECTVSAETIPTDINNINPQQFCSTTEDSRSVDVVAQSYRDRRFQSYREFLAELEQEIDDENLGYYLQLVRDLLSIDIDNLVFVRYVEDPFSMTVVVLGEASVPPVFGGGIPTQSYVQNRAIAALTLPAASGDDPITYGLSPSLPDGLTFDPATRVLSGTPTAASSARTYTYTATDADGQSTSLSFTISVEASTGPVFGAGIADQSYVQNRAIAALTLPAASGDDPITYELSPSLPDGLTFDAATRVLSGTPTAVSPAGTYTYTATDTDGQSTSLSFSISVEAGAGPVFGAEIADQSYVENSAIAALTLPAASGDDPITYELSPSLPDGLTFDAATRVLSGTPTTASPARTYTYTATDSDGQSTSLSFTIDVSMARARGVTLSTRSVRVGEGQSGAYSVRLDARPEEDVTVIPRSTNPHISFSPGSLSFDESNWENPQRILFTVEEENQDASLTINHAVSGYGTVTDGGDVVVQIGSARVEDPQRQTVQDTVAGVAAATVSNVTSNIGARFSAPSAPTGGVSANVAGAPLSFQSAGVRHADWSYPSNRVGSFKEGSPDWTHRTMSAYDLLGSSSFEVALGAAEDGKDSMSGFGNRVTVWGRGDLQFFESGGGDKSGYDGDLAAGYLGADVAMEGGWLAGLAVSRIMAEADYTLGSGGGGGTLEAELTSVHPYLRAAVGDRTEVWTIAGVGRGEVTDITRDGSESRSDMSMRMLSAGARHLLETDTPIDWAVLADGSSATVETEDGVQSVDGISANVWRLRLGVEGSHTTVMDDGASVTAFLEVAARTDGGDTAQGSGLELSPGLAFSDPSSGFSVEARGRALALHSAENHREYGASLTASLAPGADGRGLSMSITPSWGTPDNGLNDSKAGLFGRDADERSPDALSLTSRVAHGFAVSEGIIAPFAEFSVRDSDTRQLRVGSRYTLDSAAHLELSGGRGDYASGRDENSVQLNVRVRF